MQLSGKQENTRVPWSNRVLCVQKCPLKLQEFWEIRILRESEGRTGDLAMFNLALDSDLQACDLVSLWAADD